MVFAGATIAISTGVDVIGRCNVGEYSSLILRERADWIVRLFREAQQTPYRPGRFTGVCIYSSDSSTMILHLQVSDT